MSLCKGGACGDPHVDQLSALESDMIVDRDQAKTTWSNWVSEAVTPTKPRGEPCELRYILGATTCSRD